jgi:hypothetical protein
MKLFPSASSIVFDPPNAFENVSKIDTGVFVHRGTASFRIRRRSSQ